MSTTEIIVRAVVKAALIWGPMLGAAALIVHPESVLRPIVSATALVMRRRGARS